MAREVHDAPSSARGVGSIVRGGGNPLDALGSLPLGFIKDSPSVVKDWSEAYLRWREVQEKRAQVATSAAETALGIADDVVTGVDATKDTPAS